MRSMVALLIGVLAVLGLSVPAHANAPVPAPAAVVPATCDYDVGEVFDVVLHVPRASLGSGLGCADVRSRIQIGPPTQQSGPGSTTRTWHWEICI